MSIISSLKSYKKQNKTNLTLAFYTAKVAKNDQLSFDVFDEPKLPERKKKENDCHFSFYSFYLDDLSSFFLEQENTGSILT